MATADQTDAGFPYENGTLKDGGVSRIALRDSRCQANIVREGEKRDCPHQAKYFMLGDGDVVGMCGVHVPDLWKEAYRGEREVGFEVIFAGDQTCDSWVVKQDEDKNIERHGCRAKLLLINHDGTRHAVCDTHAKDCWYDDIRQD